MNHVIVKAIGTATPPYWLEQSQAETFATQMFREGLHDLERLLPIFHNTQIERRALACPLSWYGQSHTFKEANDIYLETSLSISEQAARAALEKAQIDPHRVGAVLFVTSTGIATPSLDSPLMQRLGISPHALRIPLWGLGCAGGISGLARAAQLAQCLPSTPILLVATELCTLTFQANDMSKANLVATSLFGDGSAAILLESQPKLPDHTPSLEILQGHSTLFPNTEYVMGWDLIDSGLMVRFDRSIPHLVLEHLPRLFAQACHTWNLSPDSIPHIVAHPGGARVLAAYAESLQRPVQTFRHAYDILRNYGNMSSPTVLFVLDQFMRDVPAQQQHGVMLAWGPGFSAEQLLFRW